MSRLAKDEDVAQGDLSHAALDLTQATVSFFIKTLSASLMLLSDCYYIRAKYTTGKA